jgi:hypothetical protein
MKISYRGFAPLPFKVSGYFTRVLMRNRSMFVYKLIKNIFQNGQFFLNFSHINFTQNTYTCFQNFRVHIQNQVTTILLNLSSVNG